MKKIGVLLVTLFQVLLLQGQVGTLQIYCQEGATVYLNDKYLGKTTTAMHGFLAENVAVGEVNVSVYLNGFESQTKTVLIKENQVAEVSFDLVKNAKEKKKSLGFDLHFGAFGLFNVNNVFTKADYSTGITPYFDYKLHPNFSLGTEVMFMWGKPATTDQPRMMISPNLRFNLLFNPFEKVGFNILVASGFSLWPGNTQVPQLTPTFNATRTGWDFRACAGATFKLNTKVELLANFGYWASSSTSDNIVWITHDSMIISLGPKLKF